MVYSAQEKAKCVEWYIEEKENVNGANYLQMLQQFFLPHVQGFQDVIFMQDGAPPHWSLAVQNWLDENFTLRWMSRGTPASPAPFA